MKERPVKEGRKASEVPERRKPRLSQQCYCTQTKFVPQWRCAGVPPWNSGVSRDRWNVRAR